jgi:hypothetical protein
MKKVGTKMCDGNHKTEEETLVVQRGKIVASLFAYVTKELC